jgi:hypothetical protein
MQLLIGGFAETSLTKREKDFLDALELGVHETGRPLHAYEAALKVIKSNKPMADRIRSAQVTASKILNGGDASISEEKRKAKLAAIHAYREHLRQQKQDEARIELLECVRHHRELIQIGLGKKKVSKTITQVVIGDEGNTRFAQQDVKEFMPNLTAVNQSLVQMAKLGGLVIDKKEVTGANGEPLNSVLTVEYIDTDSNPSEGNSEATDADSDT